jgi:hypothetical protein
MDMIAALASELGRLKSNGHTAASLIEATPGIQASTEDEIRIATREILAIVDPDGDLIHTDAPTRIINILMQRPTITNSLGDEVATRDVLVTRLKPTKSVRDFQALTSSTLTKLEDAWDIKVGR